MENLPSVGQMFKLIVVLILALIAISIVLEIVKVLLPVAFIIAIVAGAYYLYQKMQENGKAKRA
jgi:hypothetical protein